MSLTERIAAGLARRRNKRAALEWVNGARVLYALGAPLSELPKGHPHLSACCPLARALSGGLRGADASVGAGGGWVRLPGETIFLSAPDPVASFVRAFDRGEYPELIEAGA